MNPETRYAMVGELGIAYQTFGRGPPDLIWTAGTMNHTDEQWEDPAAAVFLRRVAGFARLTRFDPLGTGASDRLPPGISPPSFVEQLESVRTACDIDKFALFAMMDSGPGAIAYAANSADKVSHLVLYNTSARIMADDDYPIGLTTDVMTTIGELFQRSWGTEEMARAIAPHRANDSHHIAWLAKYMRAVGTPREVWGQLKRIEEVDVRELLGLIRCPTLVLYKEWASFIPESHAEYITDRISQSIYMKLPGTGASLYDESPDFVLSQLEAFIAGSSLPQPTIKSLKALLFTDIVGSTERLERLGDRDWSAVLGIHDQISAKRSAQYGGSLVKSTGDGVLASFESPVDAIHAAVAIRDELARMSLDIRSGIHFGEVEETPDDLLGVSVHIAARVMSSALPGEILITRTARDLAFGSISQLVDAGKYELKGISDAWQLYRLEAEPA